MRKTYVFEAICATRSLQSVGDDTGGQGMEDAAWWQIGGIALACSRVFISVTWSSRPHQIGITAPSLVTRETLWWINTPFQHSSLQTSHPSGVVYSRHTYRQQEDRVCVRTFVWILLRSINSGIASRWYITWVVFCTLQKSSLVICCLKLIAWLFLP